MSCCLCLLAKCVLKIFPFRIQICCFTGSDVLGGIPRTVGGLWGGEVEQSNQQVRKEFRLLCVLAHITVYTLNEKGSMTYDV